MIHKHDNTEARERVLVVAERLFAQRGYASVTLRDIAGEVGIKHTSLYYHVPGGKEELFIEVSERMFERHRLGLTTAIAQAELTIRAQLQAAAGWLLEQPPMDFLRMVHADLPAINHVHAQRLTFLSYETLIGPLETALRQAKERGEIAHEKVDMVAGGIFGMLQSLHAIPEQALEQSRLEMAWALIDVVLNGLRPR